MSGGSGRMPLMNPNAPSKAVIHRSASAAERRARAVAWLRARPAGSQLVVLGGTLEAAADLIREAGAATGAGFGWHRFTLSGLAATLAAPLLADEGVSPVSGLPLEALCARVIHELAGRGELSELEPVANLPGLARALARTSAELRLANLAAVGLPGGLQAGLLGVEAQLRDRKLADRADLLRLATRALVDPARRPNLAGLPLLLLDLPVAAALERDLIAALAGQSDDVLATIPAGDEASAGHLRAALGGIGDEQITRDQSGSSRSLDRVQRHLFAETSGGPQARSDDLDLFSAPGEGRECVEIARRILQEAEKGVAFDRMAILLRAPLQYRAHLEEALQRAGVPAFFARGTSKPDPSGRAFLALLGCAAQGLSASRFAEYLSLGEVPDATAAGSPPPATSAAERDSRPDDEAAAALLAEPDGEEPVDAAAQAEADISDPDAAVHGGALRAPARWERLIVEAAVIGGTEGTGRWQRRLAGLGEELRIKLRECGQENENEAKADKLRRDLVDLAALQQFALPLLETLHALPRQGTWGQWLEALASLATRALRRPDRVLSLLAELQPLSPVGPVGLPEVRLSLSRRLSELSVPPRQKRFGRVFIAPIEAARGLSFDAVFVPGLAEKIFPPKLTQDPLLRDRDRAAISPALEVEKDRVQAERLALRLAVGAARTRLHLSFPRLDAQVSRPRMPSFYALEIVRAAEGKLPGFTELMRAAETAANARVGWPAPKAARDAIDEAEHDLALLDDVLRLPDDAARGTARYLLDSNPHLGRALRARGRRFRKKWLPTDGLVTDPKRTEPEEAVKAALQQQALSARSYSATALQHFAACPYRFLLQAVHRLAPREQPEAVDEIDPASRGSLMHEVQFELLEGLQRDGLLPLDEERLAVAKERLAKILEDVAKKWKEKLFPAIDRVWRDGIGALGGDLRRWLELVKDEPRFVPSGFELAFGLPPEAMRRDKDSVREAVALPSGLKLRGSIDLVERDAAGALRATDYKSGKQRAKAGVVIDGGKALQPVLYALALEQLNPGATVEGGRLFYCTHGGGFESVWVPLDAAARGAADLVVKTVGDALAEGFFPAAPNDRECDWCDYLTVCGPSAAAAARRKPVERLASLVQLRVQR